MKLPGMLLKRCYKSGLVTLSLFLITTAALAQVAGNVGSTMLNAFARHKAMQVKPGPQFRLTGPDNRSGRCTQVAGVPGNPNIMYAGFATGGFWKTEDAGKNWMPLFDQEATQSIGNFSLAPSDPNIIYVGTGEANILRASLPGCGMYKSVDAGKTFRHIGLTNSGTIARVVVHPVNPNIVFAAASGNEWTYNDDRGVFKTTDGGLTWKRVLFENNRSGCIDLVMDPSDPNILYASMWNRIRKRYSDPVPEDGDHLYKSTDGGNTWKPISKGLPNTKFTGRIGLAISNSNPSVVYAFIDDHTIKRQPHASETDSYERQVQKVVIGGVIYRSTNKGETWQKMGEVHDFIKPFSGTYGWVFSQVRVHPKIEDEIYALGVNMVKSTDGGLTFTNAQSRNKESDWVHGDNHALWIDPVNPNYRILGNDGGVSSTQDGGNIWKNYFSKIPTTQFYTVTYDMEKPFNIFGAVQDEGTMSASSELTFGKPTASGLRLWRMAPGGEGTQIQIHPDSSNIVYSSSYYGRLMRTDMSKPDSLQRRQNRMFAVGAVDSLRADWLAATTMSAFDSKTIYHGLQHIYRSKDGGNSWEMISPDLTENRADRKGVYPYLIYHQAVTSIAEGERAGVLVAGTDDGKVWMTENDGKQWKQIGKSLPAYMHVAKVMISKHMPNSIYVVLNNRRSDDATPMIYLTNNKGVQWKNIGRSLPNSPVNVIAEHPAKSNVIFAGTDLGLYISSNNGTSWKCINGNMPSSVSVNDMFIHPRDKKMVIATYGRGVYILDDLNQLDK